MQTLIQYELSESSVCYLGIIREKIFFNKLILPKAKSESLLTIFKLEQGMSLTDSELTNFNLHLCFIGEKEIERTS